MTVDTNTNLFGLFGLPKAIMSSAPELFAPRAADPRRIVNHMDTLSAYAKTLRDLADMFQTRAHDSQFEAAARHAKALNELAANLMSAPDTKAMAEYVVDATQRAVLFADTLRRRGNMFIQHETKGCPPVLHYEYDVVVDGSTLAQPVNYSLVRIRAPQGVQTSETARPYIIIDPRAGHGSGIGGFKSESEVGVALQHGHPVYFAIFTTHPQPGQTMADVCRAEAHFVREVIHLHPDSPKPVIVGNCQGGWASMLLAATNPDLTGPVVINGSPMSYWAGQRGKTPLRYLGGMVGGVWMTMLMADLGNGQFDGANLVLNFESLNPANTWWRKYYDVFAHGDDETERYLEFERWWSGFYFMNEPEIRWIVDNLFVGNRLARGGVNLDRRLHVDLRDIRAPVIVFASHGDNITPPPQALNWIADTYANVREIKARGQKIIYTIHDSIGHLGIFVSSSVARKQHEEITETLKVIEDLSPGLYEMKIIDVHGDDLDRSYEVDFEERSIDDILALDDSRADELPLAAAARVSDLNARLYEMTARPYVRAIASPGLARALVNNHPLRSRRYAMSDRNPLMAVVAPMAELVREQRRPSGLENPYLQLERIVADVISDGWNAYRDIRDAMIESFVFSVYGSPYMRILSDSATGDFVQKAPPTDELLSVPEVRMALENIEHGNYADAVIRMLIMLARSRKAVRRDRLERSNKILNETEPFASLTQQARNHIVHQQGIVVEFDPEHALRSLPHLLNHHDARVHAVQTCAYIAGPIDDADVLEMFNKIKAVLGVSEVSHENIDKVPAALVTGEIPATPAATPPKLAARRSTAKKPQA